MKKNSSAYGFIILIIVLLCGWVAFFHFYPPQKIVHDIGIQNTYLVAFILALFGGFSSFTGTSLEATLFAFAHSGVHPIALGFISGIGLFASDSIFYFIMLRMRSLLSKMTTRWNKVFKRIWNFIYKRPKWLVMVGIFCFAAFLPLPNDLMLVVLAVSGYSYQEFWLYLLLGDLTFTLLVTAFGSATAAM